MPYALLSKMAHKGGGGKTFTKNCPHGLWTTTTPETDLSKIRSKYHITKHLLRIRSARNILVFYGPVWDYDQIGEVLNAKKTDGFYIGFKGFLYIEKSYFVKRTNVIYIFAFHPSWKYCECNYS